MSDPSDGKLLIISGPSGAGKSTVLAELVRDESPFVFSISATTRTPREGEADGKDYFFLTQKEFQERRSAGEFLECKEVFGRGDWYGTLRSQVASGLKRGKWVVLEIDVRGALSIMERVPTAATIFIHPGSMEELERRLRKRATEEGDVIRRRLEVAQGEMQQRGKYQFEVINDTAARAVEAIRKIAQTAPTSPVEFER
jgi:guanylate kinase